MLKRVLIWNDGSSEALYMDGSVISLHKDRSSFDYVGDSCVVQVNILTRFARDEPYEESTTSGNKHSIKSKLLNLLHFVNSHITEPYLARPNIPIKDEKDVVKRWHRIMSASWIFSSQYVIILSSGSVQVNSVDENVRLTVMPNGRRMKASYFAEIQKSNNDCSLMEREYIPINQYFSVSSFPENWIIPFTIAMYYYVQHHGIHNSEYDYLFRQLNHEQEYHTELPTSKLPEMVSVYRSSNHERDLANRAKMIQIFDSTNGSQGRSIASCVISDHRIIYLEYVVQFNLLYQYVLNSRCAEVHSDDLSLISTGNDQYKLYYFENSPAQRSIIHSKNCPSVFVGRQRVNVSLLLPDLESFRIRATEMHQTYEEKS